MKGLRAANPDACVQYLLDCASALVAAAAVVVNMRKRTPEQDPEVVFTVVK